MRFIYNTNSIRGATQTSLQELRVALNTQRTIIAVLKIKSSLCSFVVISWDEQYRQFICHLSGDGFACNEGGSESGRGYKMALDLIWEKLGGPPKEIDIGLKGIHYSDYIHTVTKEIEDYLSDVKKAVESIRDEGLSEEELCEQLGLSYNGVRILIDELPE